MFKYKLQRFAEEAEAEETQESATEEAKEPIPEELDGLPEDIAREAMAQAKQESAAQKDAAENEPEANGDQDTENKPVGEGLEEPQQKIPYVRFKQQVDKSHELEEQLNAYKKKFGDLSAQQAPPPAQQVSQQQTAPQLQQATPQQSQIRITDDDVKIINQAAAKGALQLTGMTQEEYDALEYADDDDPKKQRFKLALDIAKNNIVRGIEQEQMQRAAMAQQFLAVHKQTVDDYNSFVQQAMQEPDAPAIKDFATNEYFDSMSPARKNTIAASYARIERNTASPAEIELVKTYYAEARDAYHAKHPRAAQQPPNQKISQAEKMPRADQVSGTSGGDKPMTEATLRQMLNDTPWDKIPEKYQNILLGITTP